jgi:hypothetical protein
VEAADQELLTLLTPETEALGEEVEDLQQPIIEE